MYVEKYLIIISYGTLIKNSTNTSPDHCAAYLLSPGWMKLEL